MLYISLTLYICTYCLQYFNVIIMFPISISFICKYVYWFFINSLLFLNWNYSPGHFSQQDWAMLCWTLIDFLRKGSHKVWPQFSTTNIWNNEVCYRKIISTKQTKLHKQCPCIHLVTPFIMSAILLASSLCIQSVSRRIKKSYLLQICILLSCNYWESS